MSEDDKLSKLERARGPIEDALGGVAKSALGGLAGGSTEQRAMESLGNLADMAIGAASSSLGSLDALPQVLSPGMDLASSFAQQGLDAAVNLIAGSIGGPALPKVEYTLELSDGPDVLWQIRRMHLTEALSEPYTLLLDLVTEDIEADTDSMLGASIELQIARDVLVRRVCGVIHQVEYIGVVHDRLQIRVKIGPALFVLGQRVDIRLWQNITVPDVIKEVLEAGLGDYGRTLKIDGLTARYSPREYIVQYRESDLDFVHRLLEEEGITYWFDHGSEEGNEVMVLEDSNDNYVDVDTIDDEPGLQIIIDRADNAEIESIQHFGWNRELTSTSVSQRIFDWLDPTTPILATGPAEGGDDADERGRLRAIYHHGHFVEPDPQPRTVRKLMHLRQRDRIARGVGNVTGLFPGIKFSIAEHRRADLEQEYLIRRIVHTGDCPDVMMGEGEVEPDGPCYENRFECMVLDPADPYRPPNVTPRPRIYGPQTAIVTGPEGEEIHTDEHGRVKVLFNWDRVNQRGDDTSMWIRVAHHWAGPGFGTFFVPRIGMEVVVEFIEGDPAKPLINGCVYNGVNRSSVEPAESKTQSVIRTRSSPDNEGYNEILFEDLNGSESISLHAQKDLSEIVENSHSTTVKGKQSNSVGGDQSNSVSGDQTETVSGKQTMTVEKNRSVTVHGSQSVTIKGGAAEDGVSGSKLNVTGDWKADATNTIEMQARSHIKLTCGGSTIEMIPGKITLSAGGSAKLVLDANALMQSAAGSKVLLDGNALTQSNGGAKVLLDGNALTQSNGGSKVLLDGNALMSSPGTGTVQAPTATLAGGGGSVQAGGAGVTCAGGQINVSGGMVNIAGGMVAIN
jgi:type VI secretion system secreted protein VgrG